MGIFMEKSSFYLNRSSMVKAVLHQPQGAEKVK